MGDTSISLAGRTLRLSKAAKAGLIYVTIDVTLSSLTGLGQTLYELKQEDWNKMWAAQHVGWVMLQVGGILSSALLTLKAYVSNSNKTTP